MSFSRRQVLTGAAGFTLALPMLPSLLPRAAHAIDPDGPRRFVAFASGHGGVWQEYLYPAESTLTESRSYAGWTIHRGQLSAETRDGTTAISDVLSAASDVLTPSILDKMNVIRGFDWPWYISHHTGGHLGNAAATNSSVPDALEVKEHPRPTIDQVLAWSNHFYRDTSTIVERSLVLGDYNMSSGYSDPANQRGEINFLPAEFDSLDIFERLFRDKAPSGRAPVVDLVLEDYRRLRDSNRRISAGDRRRLNEHVERLYELERRLHIDRVCEDIPTPSESSDDVRFPWAEYSRSPERHARAWALLNDLIVAAFSCDATRIATGLLNRTYHTYPGNWHQDVAHLASQDAEAQQRTVTSHQRMFEGVFLDLVAKLDAVPTATGTLLDQTLVQWTHESGPYTHHAIEMPVITAGAAGGAISTGHYVDYRNRGSIAKAPRGPHIPTIHTGLMYNQWLGTVLQSMGLPREAYERDGHAGYGILQLSSAAWYAGTDKYNADVIAMMGDRAPWVGGS